MILTSNIKLFADDTLLYGLVHNSDDVTSLQSDLDKLQGRNMVYPTPIDPYFLAVILIPEPHFPQNFDPWALIKKLIPPMFLHKT